VYETLFGFVSFDQFKKDMLEVKKTASQEGVNNEPSMNAGFNVNSFDDFIKLEAEDITDPALGWKKLTNCTKMNITMEIFSRP
jgi:hypothetical protein